MTEREMTIKVGVSGQETITGLQQQIANLYGQAAKAVVVNVDTKNIDQAKGAMANAAATATQEFGKAAGAAKQIGSEVENVAKSSLSTLNGAVQDVYSNVTKVAGAFAGMAAGGAIAGMSYLGAAKSDLYAKEVYAAIEANKKWGLSTDEVKARVASFAGVGWTSSSKMLANIQAAYTYGGKYARGTEEVVTGKDAAGKDIKEKMGKGEVMAQAAAKIAFNYVGPEGESVDPKDLIRTATKEGKLIKYQKAEFALQMGVDIDDKRLNSAASRIKLLESHFGDGLNDQPWKIAQQNVADLQKSIGQGIAPVMAKVTGGLAELIGMITRIPGAGALIGWIAIAVGLGGALSLLVTLGTPLVTLFTLLKGLMFGQAVANAAVASTSVAVAGAEGVEAAANMGVAASAYAMAAGMWAAIAPILLIAVPLVALAAILYLVETKTHLFSNTLKGLGKTQMAHDLVGWFKDIGYWIAQGITAIDSLYKKAGGGGGVLKMAMDVSTSGAMLLLKPTLMLVDFLYKLWVNSGGLNKLINTAMGLWKQATDFLNWLSTTLKGMWDWLMNAMPGAAKAQAGTALQKSLDQFSGTKNALTYEGNGKYKWTENGGYTEYSFEEMKNLVEVGKTGQGGVALDKLRWYNIAAKSAKYDALPGFAEGVAQAVAQGLGGLGTIIAAAVTSGLTGVFPDFSPLTTAINSLLEWFRTHLPSWGGEGTKPPGTGEGGWTGEGGYMGKTPSEAYEYAKQQMPGHELEFMNQNYPGWSPESTATSVTPSPIPQNSIPQKASGGLVLTKGLIIGDPGEPIIPAKVASSSHLQEVLTAIANGGGNMGNGPIGPISITVQVQKLDSNTDIKKASKLLTDAFLDKLNFKNRNNFDKLGMRGVAIMRG